MLAMRRVVGIFLYAVTIFLGMFLLMLNGQSRSQAVITIFGSNFMVMTFPIWAAPTRQARIRLRKALFDPPFSPPIQRVIDRFRRVQGTRKPD
jgi:hypothetical protein